MSFIRKIWQEASLMEKAAMIAALLYIFVPLDFMPELLFGIFGIADDMAALALLFSTIMRIRHRANEAERQKVLQPAPQRRR
ncbi:MAG: YkvA family protein [Chloroherpetonaceae bacterium]|nr:YkvA family protein [Chloroherpetonaceae bacterium]MDW8019433.1 YkvA family protein [Chloroherpetonaceae bacterium]